jgi:hypothetical protein
MAASGRESATHVVNEGVVRGKSEDEGVNRLEGGDIVTHAGGCHCGRVRWEFDAPADLVAWDCNCTVCNMRRNVHTVVPAARFRLIHGDDALRTYTFGTHAAKHLFCETCGILSFYVPRSNPDGIAVTVHCIDAGSVAHVEVRTFDGRHWEDQIKTSSIVGFSTA